MKSRVSFALAFGLLSSVTVNAADMADPVNEAMAVTVANWSGDMPGEDLFAEDRLNRLFSQDFQTLYANAMTASEAEEAGSPFGYDVVVNAQDGCPLENLTISPPVDTDDGSDVVVRFQLMSCVGDQAEYQAFSETDFKLVMENGQPRIDDIVASNPFGMTLSAKEQLRLIADPPTE